MGYQNVHMVGSTGIDYILHADWKGARPHLQPYVVVSYQPETIDGTNEFGKVLQGIPENTLAVFIMPNPDRGSDEIRAQIKAHCQSNPWAVYHEELPHDQFLNLLHHCEFFIGNSSAIFYECPTLGVTTIEIGKRQKGRSVIIGDGLASERIVNIIKEWYGS